jgi:hypothetical protein
MKKHLLVPFAAFTLLLLASAKPGSARPNDVKRLTVEEQISTCMGIGCSGGELCFYVVGNVAYFCSGVPQQVK